MYNLAIPTIVICAQNLNMIMVEHDQACARLEIQFDTKLHSSDQHKYDIQFITLFIKTQHIPITRAYTQNAEYLKLYNQYYVQTFLNSGPPTVFKHPPHLPCNISDHLDS